MFLFSCIPIVLDKVVSDNRESNNDGRIHLTERLATAGVTLGEVELEEERK